jgi:hypothetical protein
LASNRFFESILSQFFELASTNTLRLPRDFQKPNVIQYGLFWLAQGFLTCRHALFSISAGMEPEKREIPPGPPSAGLRRGSAYILNDITKVKKISRWFAFKAQKTLSLV